MKKASKPKKSNGLHDAHIYLPKDLYEGLQNESTHENRTITGQVRHILQERYSQMPPR